MATSILDRRKMAEHDARWWHTELSLVQKITLALGFACIIGIAAQIRLPLAWTPVPITAQTMAVLLVGVVLGWRWGGVSLAIYAGLGAVGLPWFNGGMGGIGIIAGPTGGYIIGFILAALFIGYLTGKYAKLRSFPGMLGLMLFASVVLIYIPGLTQLYLWLSLIKGQAAGFHNILAMGFLPFIAGDIVKVFVAAGIARFIVARRGI